MAVFSLGSGPLQDTPIWPEKPPVAVTVKLVVPEPMPETATLVAAIVIAGAGTADVSPCADPLSVINVNPTKIAKLRPRIDRLLIDGLASILSSGAGKPMEIQFRCRRERKAA
jgi:hypothetical protein